MGALFANVRRGTGFSLVGSLAVPVWMGAISAWALHRYVPDMMVTRGGSHARPWAAGALLAIFVLALGATFTDSPYELPQMSWRLAQHLAVLLLVPFAEELLFRGLLFRLLSNLLGPLLGAVAVSLLFGLLHPWLPFGWAMVALSLVFCATVHTSGTLWWAVILHLVWNGWAEAYHAVDSTDRLLIAAIGTFVGLAMVWRGLATREAA
jgi:membrane protease YdiL (CAAX protease family)